MANESVTLTIRISKTMASWVRKVAEKREEHLGDTVDRILQTAHGRLKALDTYAKKQKQAERKKAAKAAARRAKKAAK